MGEILFHERVHGLVGVDGAHAVAIEEMGPRVVDGVGMVVIGARVRHCIFFGLSDADKRADVVLMQAAEGVLIYAGRPIRIRSPWKL